MRGVRERLIEGSGEQRGRWEGGGGVGRTPFFFVTIEPVGISVCGVWACVELYETEEQVLR